MGVQLNHTIVRVHDKHESARFLAEILGLDDPTPYGPFLIVQVDNDVSPNFADDHGPVNPQHYAFLVSETDFDDILGRIRARGCRTGPTPGGTGPARSTPTTEVEACAGRTRADTSSRSSPVPTVAEAERTLRVSDWTPDGTGSR